jgi:hypothetical protein
MTKCGYVLTQSNGEAIQGEMCRLGQERRLQCCRPGRARTGTGSRRAATRYGAPDP